MRGATNLSSKSKFKNYTLNPKNTVGVVRLDFTDFRRSEGSFAVLSYSH